MNFQNKTPKCDDQSLDSTTTFPSWSPHSCGTMIPVVDTDSPVFTMSSRLSIFACLNFLLTLSVPEGPGKYGYENSMTRGITLQQAHTPHMKKSVCSYFFLLNGCKKSSNILLSEKTHLHKCLHRHQPIKIKIKLDSFTPNMPGSTCGVC